MSAFPTVVDDAALCGRAGEFVLAREPHSEIAALRSARASARLLARQRAGDASLRVRLRAALDEGQRQREEISRLRQELRQLRGEFDKLVSLVSHSLSEPVRQ